MVIIADGYDLAVAGVALPTIMKQMQVDPTTAGFMASSALFGMAPRGQTGLHAAPEVVVESTTAEATPIRQA